MTRAPHLVLTAMTLICGLAPGTGSSPSAAAERRKPPLIQGGQIGTLQQGTYACEMPGDAGGPVGKPLPEFSFRIVNASSYKAGGIRGAYLLTGNKVTMTGGTLRGIVMERVSTAFLREITGDAGKPGMRCVLTSRR